MASKPNIHLFVGEDDYLVEAAARRVIDASVPAELRAAAVETVDGNASNAETQLAAIRAARASVETPPFLDPVKLTWWRGVSFLPAGGKNKLAEDVKTALERFADALAKHPPPANQFLVVTAPRLMMTSIFAKLFKSFANVAEFGGGGKAKDRLEDARLRLPDLADEEHLSFAPGAAEAFLAKVGADTRTVVNELAKLRAYLGADRDTVTPADVAAVTSVTGTESETWEITDAVGRRDTAQLMKVLASQAKDGFGILVSTILERFFREALVCRDAMDNGWLDKWARWSDKMPPAARADYDAAGVGPGSPRAPWQFKRLCQHAAAYTLTELRTARWRMLNAREKLVSSGAADDFVLTELLQIVPRPAPRSK